MITIHGVSDGVIVVTTALGTEEYQVDLSAPVCWQADLIAPGGTALRVHALYDTCWALGVGSADHSVPWPSWPVRLMPLPDSDASPLLRINAPTGTRLENIHPSPTKGNHR